MLNVTTIARICEWNAARYERKISPELQLALLQEEITEFQKAIAKIDELSPTDKEWNPTKIEVLDAIGDIAFVAVGGLWKTGFEPEEIQAMYTDTIMLALTEGTSFSTKPGAIQQFFTMPYSPLMCVTALQLAFEANPLYSLDAIVTVICDSNETKKIEKVASDVKANLDKGATYVPPTEALDKLLQHSSVILQSVADKLGAHYETTH